MFYKAASPNLGGLIDSYRVGSWFSDDYEDEFGDEDYMEPSVRCEACLCDIESKVYEYDGVRYCEDCFKDRLFEDYAEEYGVDIDLIGD